MTDVNAIIAKLESRLSALGSGRDCRSDNEKAEHWTATTSLTRTLSALKNLPADIAKRDAQLATLESRRAMVAAKHLETEQAIADAPNLDAITDRRARDTEADRQRDLRMRLQRLREGRLWLAPEDVAEPLEHLDQRIAEITSRRDRAQADLDAHLHQAATWGETVPT